MKYVPSIAFDEMSGSAKGVTAAKVRGRKYIRNRGYGGAVRTAAQAAVKSVFKQLSQSWRNLTNAQILAWNALAQTQAGKSVLGTSSKISGANLYSRLNYWIVACGGSALTTPPTLVGVETPGACTIVCTASAFTFKLDAVPADVTNLKLVIEATEGQSNGVSRAYSKAAQIKMVSSPSTSAVDIKSDYEAKNGVLGAGAPKVFFRYYFVNSATGEKSGIMLASVTWTAGE